MTAPALESVNMFLRWIVLRGVSLGTTTSFLRSFNMTSAARAIKLSEYPVAIAARVFIEHGIIIIPSVRNEPLATGAAMFSGSKLHVAFLESASYVVEVSMVRSFLATSLITRNVSTSS